MNRFKLKFLLAPILVMVILVFSGCTFLTGEDTVPDDTPTFKGIESASMVGGRLIIQYTDGSNADVGNVVGPTGPVGPGGARGPVGPEGSVGPEGPVGPAGDSAVTVGVPQAVAVAELGTNLVITVYATSEMSAVFEITFHLNIPETIDPEDVDDLLGTTYGPGGVPSINDILKWLYHEDNDVLFIHALIPSRGALMPTFNIAFDSENSIWEVFEVSFTTIGTTLPEGESEKSMVVSTSAFNQGAYATVIVKPIAETSSGGGSW